MNVCTLRAAKSVTMEQFWTWSKVDGHDTEGVPSAERNITPTLRKVLA